MVVNGKAFGPPSQCCIRIRRLSYLRSKTEVGALGFFGIFQSSPLLQPSNLSGFIRSILNQVHPGVAAQPTLLFRRCGSTANMSFHGKSCRATKRLKMAVFDPMRTLIMHALAADFTLKSDFRVSTVPRATPCAHNRLTKSRNVPALHGIGQTDFQYFDDQPYSPGKEVRLPGAGLKVDENQCSTSFLTLVFPGNKERSQCPRN